MRGDPPIYGFVREEFARLAHLRHSHHNPPQEAPPMNLIETIQAEAANIGGDIHLAYQHALETHLTTANMAAHVAARVAEFDANPLVSAVLQTGLGPQGAAALADIIRAASGGLAALDHQAQAIPLPEAPLAPLPDPAADSTPADAVG